MAFRNTCPNCKQKFGSAIFHRETTTLCKSCSGKSQVLAKTLEHTRKQEEADAEFSRKVYFFQQEIDSQTTMKTEGEKTKRMRIREAINTKTEEEHTKRILSRTKVILAAEQTRRIQAEEHKECSVKEKDIELERERTIRFQAKDKVVQSEIQLEKEKTAHAQARIIQSEVMLLKQLARFDKEERSKIIEMLQSQSPVPKCPYENNPPVSARENNPPVRPQFKYASAQETNDGYMRLI